MLTQNQVTCILLQWLQDHCIKSNTQVLIHLMAQSRGNIEAALVTLAGQRSPTPPLHPDNDSHHPITLSPVDLIKT